MPQTRQTPPKKRPPAPRRPPAVPTRDATVRRVAGYDEPFRLSSVEAWLQDPSGEPQRTMTQAEMALAFDVSPRTIRDWHERGLPHAKRGDGSVEYDSRSLRWGLRFQRLAHLNRAPRTLSWRVAERMDLEEQAQEDPAGWVLIPLCWSHPARRELLARAAAGVAPKPYSEDRGAADDESDDGADDE